MEINSKTIQEITEILKKAVLCRYYCQKKLNDSFQENPKLEAALSEITDIYDSKLGMSLYYFKENFLKTKNKNPFNSNIEDYKEDALIYLNNTFPYCFGINANNLSSYPTLDIHLAFYAMSLGLKPEYLKKLQEHLENLTYKEEEKLIESNIHNGNQYYEVENISIDTIVR